MFKAGQGAGFPMRVYDLVYDGGSDHKRYLTFLAREKEAFERLIHTKAHMSLPVELMPTEATEFAATASGDGMVDGWGVTTQDTRRAAAVPRGTQGLMPGARVVVDMREFRSKLPSLLHQANFEVVPVTIEIGDYVLSPEICVERKSVSDLVQSLASGRLFNQAKAMTRAYKMPVLLIEFDGEKTISLAATSAVAAAQHDVSINQVTSKLVVLSMHFPSLRILWARDPQATVQMFAALKRKQLEPDPRVAASYGADGAVRPGYEGSADDVGGAPDSLGLRDFLMKLPGISVFNIRQVVGGVRCMADLARMTLPELAALMGPASARSLHAFLHAAS